MDLLCVVLRTLFFYFFITLAYRLMGKREIAKLGIIDLIVSILIAELVAISIENYNDSIYLTVVPIIILVILEILLAIISLKSSSVRVFLEGKPSLIICEGKINYHEMVKQRYSLDDLLLSLREKEIDNIEDVEYAVLEANGKLSIFKYKAFKRKNSYPLPIIIDGKINKDSLKYLKKDEEDIINLLNKKDIKLNNIFYGFYKNKKLYIVNKTN